MWPFSPSYPALNPIDVGIQLLQGKDAGSDACTYDYIVVGGGTAGCCLASRLSEDPTVTVLLLERGGVFDTWANRVPLLSGDIFKKDGIARPSKSMPIANADNRVVTILRGEALGGGSRVNAMIYTRGVPGEYNLWRDLGHPDWSYESLKPYFVKSENSLNQSNSDFRGKEGPWENRTFQNIPWSSLGYVKNAALSLGIPYVPDYNSPSVPSVSLAALDIAIDRNMRRSSTYAAFLPPPLANARKSHLKVCTGALASCIVFDHSTGSQPRAVGVEFKNSDRKSGDATFFAKARREVILCCGALGTPQLLLLSGIGSADHLKEHDIPVVLDNPGVGQHLKDHIDLPLIWHVPLDDSMHVLLKKPWRAVLELAKYVVTGGGLFSSPFVHMAIFLPTRLLNENMEVLTSEPLDLDTTLPENRPDIEIKPIPVQGLDPSPDFVVPGGAFTFMVCLLKPKSLGYIHLNSADAHEKPRCHLNLLSDPEDVAVLVKGVRLALRLADQVRTRGYPFRDFVLPASESQEDIEAYIRANARTTYHYSSSCRMAPISDPIPGVVDDDLRVHGITGLRICDTSVFPEIPAGHTMAPAVVVAEKCADMIKEQHRGH